MSSIGDVLRNRGLDEPPEIAIIKKFVRDKYDYPASVTVKDKQVIVAVPSAALAGTLRHDSQELSKLCQTKKRLVFRVGS